MKTYRHYSPFKVILIILLYGLYTVSICIINDHYQFRGWVCFFTGALSSLIFWWILYLKSDFLLKY
jgi:hypothetical protein